MSESQIRKWEAEVRELLQNAGPHNHKVRIEDPRKASGIVVEEGCPRCRKIKELLSK